MSDLRAMFGLAVRAARLAKGMSQEQLGAAAGVDRTYVSGLERGRRNPSLLTQGRIASALGVTLAELVREPEEQG